MYGNNIRLTKYNYKKTVAIFNTAKVTTVTLCALFFQQHLSCAMYDFVFNFNPLYIDSFFCLSCPIQTADADETKLSSRVGGVYWASCCHQMLSERERIYLPSKNINNFQQQ